MPARGRTCMAGPIGPKGDTGAWPADAYDDLARLIATLRADVDDLRTTVAALQEDAATTSFSGRYRRLSASSSERDQSES